MDLATKSGYYVFTTPAGVMPCLVDLAADGRTCREKKHVCILQWQTIIKKRKVLIRHRR